MKFEHPKRLKKGSYHYSIQSLIRPFFSGSADRLHYIPEGVAPMFKGAADLEDVNLPPIRHKCDISKKTVKTVRLSGFRRNALTYRLFATRQLADNRQVVNCLSVRMLQPKTRWSDSFSEILVFTENHRYWQLLLISINIT